MTVTSNYKHPIFIDQNSQIIENEALKNNVFFLTFINIKASQTCYATLGSYQQAQIRNTSCNILINNNFYFLKEDSNGSFQEVSNMQEIKSEIGRQLSISYLTQHLQNTLPNEIDTNSLDRNNPYQQHIFLQSLELQNALNDHENSMSLKQQLECLERNIKIELKYRELQQKLDDGLKDLLNTHQIKNPRATFYLAKKFTDNLEISLDKKDIKTAIYSGKVAQLLIDTTKKNITSRLHNKPSNHNR